MKQILSILSVLAVLSCSSVQEKTAGLGHYPGNLEESGAPALVAGNKEYRNLALNRATRHSSSLDFNLTSQLAVDGMVSEGSAPWMETLISGNPVGKTETEHLFDGRSSTRFLFSEQSSEIEIRFHNMPVTADKIELQGFCYGGRDLLGVEGEVSVDGGSWKKIPSVKASDIESSDHKFVTCISLKEDVQIEALKLKFNLKGNVLLHTVDFYHDGKLKDVLPSLSFHSAWKSAGSSEEWIEVDLGAESSFDRMCFQWQNPPVSGSIQTSSDGKTWTKWSDLTETVISKKGKARYIRAALDKTADGQPFELKEWEIFGRGGVVAQSRPAKERSGNIQELTRGKWEVRRDSDEDGWIVATVPGTVLSSYVNIGALHDPDHADNQIGRMTPK